MRAVGLARLEPLQDALSVEHVAARDGRELVGSREELEAGGAADPHDDDDLTGMLRLEKKERGDCGRSVLLPKYVDVFPARHLLPLFDPQFVGDVVKPLDLVQERRYGQVSELLMYGKSYFRTLVIPAMLSLYRTRLASINSTLKISNTYGGWWRGPPA